MAPEKFVRSHEEIVTRLLADRAAQLATLQEIDDEITRYINPDAGSTAGAWLDYGAVLRLREAHGERYSTGMPGLDAKIDGGLHRGSVVVIQGKPGSGKTLLASQIALGLSKRCAVGALYADEGLAGAAVTVGQQLGAERIALGAGEPDMVALAESRMSEQALCFRFLDPCRPESTLEFLAESFAKIAGPLPAVWLLDSAQVLRSEKKTGKMDSRQGVSTVLLQIRELALRHRAIALVVSQVNRASYRNKDDAQNIDPLAAGMESSSIEFMSELICHLDGDPKGVIRARFPKNRLSAEGPFELSLKLDFPRKRFLEVNASASEDESRDASDAVMVGIEARIMDHLLRADRPRMTSGEIRDVIRGSRGIQIDEARKRLAEKKLIAYERRPGSGRALVWFAL